MQIQKPVVAILSVVLALLARADTVTFQEQALGTRIGSTVEVRLNGKERPNKLRGQMGQLDNKAFDLVSAESGDTRSIPFGQVKSMKVVKNPPQAKPIEPGPTLEATASAIPKGSLVEVRFTGKHKPSWLRGRIGEAGSQEFQIQVFQSGKIDVQTLRFAEVESVKPVDSLWVQSPPAKVGHGIGIGVGIALAAGLVVVIVAVIVYVTHMG
ncbi:MAG: hypothetical protein ABSC08_10155 [Bryobacteraceae bacterium]|jgi:hypothetical protein